MFRDYLVGFLVSCSLLLWLVLGTQHSSISAQLAAPVTEELELVQLPDVKHLDEEPLPASSEAEEQEPLSFPPPQMMDIPSSVPINDTTFYQPLAVPPPPGAATAGMLIPKSQYSRPPATKAETTPVFVDKTQLDAPPRARTQIQPSYPTDMELAGVKGSVLLELSIETDGSVSAVKVLRASNQRFEQSVMSVIMKWRFEPGRIGGKKVRFRTTQPFNFALQE